jgi:hypothetical protein
MVVLDESNSYESNVPLPICQRVPGFDPAVFWQESPGLPAWSAMHAKYEALVRAAQLAAGPRGDDYRAALTELSSRWPGGLREGELIGPEHVERRRAAARAGMLDPSRARADWPDADAQAVICWAELHALIRDELDFREARTGSSSSEAFAAWITTGDAGDRAARWPRPERIAAIVGPRLRVRSAYLWLAARSGLDLPSLNELLLARSGHWDRRNEDPEWAHERTPR